MVCGTGDLLGAGLRNLENWRCAWTPHASGEAPSWPGGIIFKVGRQKQSFVHNEGIDRSQQWAVLMDLLIHVGLHKTGTTTAQESLLNHRERMLDHKILYPLTGLYEAQHALFPGVLIPEHAHLDTVCRSLDLDHYGALLQAEISDHRPELVILSSEVFTEIISQEEECRSLLSAIGEPFDTTRLLLTLREFRQLALSSLKHCAREKRTPWIDDPIQSFIESMDSIDHAVKFWNSHDASTISKYLEDGGADCLTEHYFGDILREYQPLATRFFAGATSAQTQVRHRKLNSDFLPLPFYLLLFLLGNHPRDFSLASRPVFYTIKTVCTANQSWDFLSQAIQNRHLLGYLDYFYQIWLATQVLEFAVVPMENKQAALHHSGLPKDVVAILLELLPTIDQALAGP